MSLYIRNSNELEGQPIEFADESLVNDLFSALFSNAEIQVNCYTCRKPIPAGTGSFCEQHHK